MSENIFQSRIIHKHDVEANWLKAVNFIPKKGEIIVYDVDGTYTYERIKIGDGVAAVSALPFADNHVTQEISALNTTVNNVSTKVDEVSELVGDTPVSSQIAASNIIYVGANMPTDPNIKVWINTSEEGTGVIPMLPRATTVTLTSSGWTGSASPYRQVVSINTVTAATKIDLQPTSSQIVSLQNAEIALMAENSGGTVTIYSFGGKPAGNMTMQVLLTEVSYI